jgi:hypothetical protein
MAGNSEHLRGLQEALLAAQRRLLDNNEGLAGCEHGNLEAGKVAMPVRSPSGISRDMASKSARRIVRLLQAI